MIKIESTYVNLYSKTNIKLIEFDSQSKALGIEMQPQHNHETTKAPTQLGEVSSLVLNPNTQILYYKNPVILNQQYSHDIIPGVYEGGFQLWQCEVEMIKQMFQLQYYKQIIANKTVAEIGCGHGLLAVAAHKLNAKHIVLQDYNQAVIEQLTKPTLQLNNIHVGTYVYGDWEHIKLPEPVDVILGSQLTYREENYAKILAFLKNNLKADGKCILANKCYYFGVGGNLADFRASLEENRFLCKSLAKIVPKTGGNKKEIIEITFDSSH